jgi:hypothetical protein
VGGRVVVVVVGGRVVVVVVGGRVVVVGGRVVVVGGRVVVVVVVVVGAGAAAKTGGGANAANGWGPAEGHVVGMGHGADVADAASVPPNVRTLRAATAKNRLTAVADRSACMLSVLRPNQRSS